MCKHKNGLFLFYANSLPGRRFVMSGSVSPLPWTGNKGCIYTTIDAFMPPHRTYVEACMGSAEVFLRKKPVEKEIINYYNGDLVLFFRVLQRNENLERLITYNNDPYIRELADHYGFDSFVQERLHNMRQATKPGDMFEELLIGNYDLVKQAEINNHFLLE